MTRRLSPIACFVLFLLSALVPGIAGAMDLHVDPKARTGGDGSAARPFDTVQAALSGAPGPGTRIVLAKGFHGALVLRNVRDLVIDGSDGAAILSSILIQGATGVTVRSVTVDWSRQAPAAADARPGSGVAVRVSGSGIVLDGLAIRSAEDGSGWTDREWRALAASGIFARGDGMVIRNNRLSFVRHGIQLVGSKGMIDGNTVAHFSADGMRAIGDFNIVQDNLVHSCYRVDKNHDDGFQSWSIGPDGRAGTGVTRGTVLRRNKILSYLKPGHPLQCRLQGIGMFDGIYEDWLIENNLVVVDHWHGITVMGATRVVIRNNTVVDPVDNRVGPAAIRILPHKDKRQPLQSLVANNLVPGKASAQARGFPTVRDGVDHLGNVFYGNPRNVFRDPERFDFRPHAKSYGNDYAKGDVPADDLTGLPRPWGKRADVGAYEYRGD